MSELTGCVAIGGGFKVTIIGDEVEASFLKTLSPIAFNSDSKGDSLDISSSSNSRVVSFSYAGKRYIFKEFLSRGLLEPVKALFRGTRAKKAYLGARLLEENGFLTPHVALYGVKTSLGLPRRDFIVTRFVEGAIGINAFLRGPFTSLSSKERRAAKMRIIKLLGSLLGRLHSKGIVHGDIRHDNILLRGLEDSGELKAYLIDNERNAYFKKIPRSQLVKNLVQINMIDMPFVSLNDRLRCYAEYLKIYPEVCFDKRVILKEVNDITVKRLRRKLNRSYLD